jgi:addiction module HigA family antidote
MKNPPHPGEIVHEECLAPLGPTITDGARTLGVARQRLNDLVNERGSISAELADRLEKTFGTSADLWMRLQTAYDFAQARKQESLRPTKQTSTEEFFELPGKLEMSDRYIMLHQA